MQIATVTEGLPFLGLAALVAALAAALDLAARSTLRGDVLQPRRPSAGRIVTSVAFVLASLPLWFVVVEFAFVSLVAFRCAPDAYECPW